MIEKIFLIGSDRRIAENVNFTIERITMLNI